MIQTLTGRGDELFTLLFTNKALFGSNDTAAQLQGGSIFGVSLIVLTTDLAAAILLGTLAAKYMRQREPA